MKKSTKVILSSSAIVSVAAAGGIVYASNLMHELLLNRNKLPSDAFATKITGNVENKAADTNALINISRENRQWLEEYGYERHYITSKRGEKLVGYLVKAEKSSDIYAFCAHGYRSNGRDEYCNLAKYYLSKGINLFIPDHVASGESEGTHCTFGVYESDDCIDWLYYLINLFGKDIKITLHGISMGAATVMMMTGRKDLPENVKIAVSDCGYSSAIDEFTEKLVNYGVPAKPIITLINSVSKIRKGIDFYTIRPKDSVQHANVPMLFVHGKSDNFIPPEMSQLCYELCGSEYKDILLVDNAAHAQSYLISPDEYKAKLDKFLDKFVL